MNGEPAFIYRAFLVRALDADTFTLNIDLGFRVHVELEVRLHGYDAPELSTDAGKAAKAAVEKLFESASEIVVQSFKGPRSGKDARTFSRWVCDVYLDGANLGVLLEGAGYAKKL